MKLCLFYSQTVTGRLVICARKKFKMTAPHKKGAPDSAPFG